MVNNASLINLIKLFNSILFLKVEAKHAVHILSHGRLSSNEQNFLSGDLHTLEPPERRWDFEFHQLHSLGLDVESLDDVQGSFILVIASEDEDCVVVKHTGRGLGTVAVELELNLAHG